MPATSSNVTRIFSGSTRRACERPKFPSPPSPPPAACARRASSTNSPTSSSVGPKPEQDLGQQRRVLVRVDFALTWTPCSCSSVVSVVVCSRTSGPRSRTASSASPWSRWPGSVTLRLNVPWIVSPVVDDRLDLAGLHLLQEVRAERHLHARLRRRLEDQHRQPVDRQQHQHEDPEAAQPMRRPRLVLIGQCRARRAPAPPASPAGRAASAMAGPTSCGRGARLPAVRTDRPYTHSDVARPSTL